MRSQRRSQRREPQDRDQRERGQHRRQIERGFAYGVGGTATVKPGASCSQQTDGDEGGKPQREGEESDLDVATPAW